MAEIRKFLFEDHRFDAPPEPVEPPEVAVERRLRAEHEAELARVRAEAHKAGRAEGEKAARESLEAQVAKTADRIAQELSAHIAKSDAAEVAASAQAVRIGTAVATRLADKLLARYPMVAVEALIEDAAKHLREMRQITITVPDEAAACLEKVLGPKIAETTARKAVRFVRDPAMPPGDARLSWADGGFIRDGAKTRATVIDAVERFLAAHGPDAAASGPGTELKALLEDTTLPSPPVTPEDTHG